MKEPVEKYKHAEKLELNEIKKEPVRVSKKVCCPSCNNDVEANNINLQNKLAKCSNCNVIFSIEKEIESVQSLNKVKQTIFRPEGIDLFSYKDELEITVQQHIQGINAFGIMIAPTIAVISIMIFFLGEKDISIYIPLISSLISLFFVYRVFNNSKNKTYIDINRDFLSIKSRPKNLIKDKEYPIDEIDQVYLKHATDGTGYYYIYMVTNSLDGQKHRKLLTVNTISKAKFLEQEIEEYLNIEDKTVPESNV